jgi:hypothetical protein
MSYLQNSTSGTFEVSGHDLSRAAKNPNRSPALAAAELQTIENKETQGLKPNIFLLNWRHD